MARTSGGHGCWGRVHPWERAWSPVITPRSSSRRTHSATAGGDRLFLYAQDGLTQRELSRMVAIEPPTVARTIDRMVRDDLVRREPHPRDGRATSIRLTPRALALRDELAAESMAANAVAAQVLSDDELETLKTLLRRVIDGLTGEEQLP